MREQDNRPNALRVLWKNKKITTKQFFFRKKAGELGIKTYVNK